MSKRRGSSVIGRVLRVSLLLPALLSAACASPQPRMKAAHYAPANAGFRIDQVAFVERNSGTFGYPRRTTDTGRTDFVARWGYVLEHSANDKIPIWVMEKIEKSQIDDELSANRPGWKADPELPEGMRAEDSDYKPFTNNETGIFDRGHMCPNADFDTREKRDETFFLSNVVPQDKRNNREIWAKLEQMVRGWVKQRGEAYVVTGGFFYDPTDDPSAPTYNPARADGEIKYQVIGDNEVAVPTHLFKVVLAPKSAGSNDWEAIAFVFENRAYDSPYLWTDGLRSIDWIESRTELNLFPNLDPLDEQRIEAATPAAMWPGDDD